MSWLVMAMTLSLFIPLYATYKDSDIWAKMLAFASVSGKIALIILVVSVWRDDWMMGVVGVLILSVGNAALMLLAHLIKRLN